MFCLASQCTQQYAVDNFNRVKLNSHHGVEPSDYINASYIDVRLFPSGLNIKVALLTIANTNRLVKVFKIYFILYAMNVQSLLVDLILHLKENVFLLSPGLHME